MYILLQSNHISNIFAEVITIKTLFAMAKSSTVVDCRSECRGLAEREGIYNQYYGITSTTFGILEL